jgi:hypothetical protein
MTDRKQYFDSINSNHSPILQFTDRFDQLLKASESNSIEDLLFYASYLESSDTDSVKARGTLIRLQCQGLEAEDLFEAYRESWGIPIFQENLLTVSDFKNGFLWKFRDHTGSWSEDQEARDWFYTSIEARFVQKYEFWSDDRGSEEMLFWKSGKYKEILSALILEADFGPLISPVFTKEELQSFIDRHDEDDLGIQKEALTDIIEQNINW